LGPLSLSVVPEPPQLRPRPAGSLFGPLSLSLQPCAAIAGSTPIAASAPPTATPPTTVPRKERRLNLRVGFMSTLPLSGEQPPTQAASNGVGLSDGRQSRGEGRSVKKVRERYERKK
jgi:hypothetical protein